MEALNYILASIIVFLGVICGNALAIIAPEEIKPGSRYIDIFRKGAYIIIILSLAYFFRKAPLYLGITLISGGVLYLAIRHRWTYPILSIPFFISSMDNNLFIIVSSLIFLYGFPVGILKAKEMKKAGKYSKVYSSIKENSPFIILSILLLIFF